jgi:succinoglycan biosynthesis protein ExoO
LQRLRLPYRWIAARPAPYSIAAPWTAQDKLYVARRAPAISRAGVVLDYLFQTEALPYLSNQPPSAIVMHDLLHARAKDFASQGLNDTVGTVDGNTEAAKLSLADAVIAIQPADAAWVRQNVPGVAVLEAPFAATMSPCVQPGDDDVLLFVGSNTAPNIIGLTWFLDEIWPIILAQRNTAILKVAGAVTRSFGGHAYKQVEFLGIVPDLGPVYAQSGIVISPLTLGSGLKVKLVEALGAGKACVVTSVTLQGVEDVTKSAVRLADTPTAFADAVLSMVADRTARADLAERALRCAREQFSTAGYVELIDWLTKGRRLEG